MDIPRIDADAAAALLDDGAALFLDVRDGASFAAAHVPGAVHVTDANVEDLVEETDKDRKLVVYCYHGHASLGGAAYFLERGFRDVASLDGGFEGWRGRHPHASS